MKKILLWDIDGTILNFEAAEREAIKKGFENFQLGNITEAMLKDYNMINQHFWRKLERGEMIKPEILVGRFQRFFTKYGIDPSVAEPFNAAYQIDLGDTICFNDDADELLKTLKQKQYLQFGVTNGTATAQHKKLQLSGLNDILDGCFISDELGVEKPNQAFFDVVFQHIEDHYGKFCLEDVLIIGDSLTSDMRGGYNANIQKCWYNPNHLEKNCDFEIEYEIDHLQSIDQCLD